MSAQFDLNLTVRHLREYITSDNIVSFGQAEIDKAEDFFIQYKGAESLSDAQFTQANADALSLYKKLLVDIMALVLWLEEHLQIPKVDVTSGMFPKVLKRLSALQQKTKQLVIFHQKIVEDYQKP